jgi:hypothetical protein
VPDRNANADQREGMERQWAVRRTGSEDEWLTAEGTWGPIPAVRWFATEHDAAAADCPEGTTGEPVHLLMAPRRSETS